MAQQLISWSAPGDSFVAGVGLTQLPVGTFVLAPLPSILGKFYVFVSPGAVDAGHVNVVIPPASAMAFWLRVLPLNASAAALPIFESLLNINKLNALETMIKPHFVTAVDTTGVSEPDSAEALLATLRIAIDAVPPAQVAVPGVGMGANAATAPNPTLVLDAADFLATEACAGGNNAASRKRVEVRNKFSAVSFGSVNACAGTTMMANLVAALGCHGRGADFDRSDSDAAYTQAALADLMTPSDKSYFNYTQASLRLLDSQKVPVGLIEDVHNAPDFLHEVAWIQLYLNPTTMESALSCRIELAVRSVSMLAYVVDGIADVRSAVLRLAKAAGLSKHLDFSTFEALGAAIADHASEVLAGFDGTESAADRVEAIASTIQASVTRVNSTLVNADGVATLDQARLATRKRMEVNQGPLYAALLEGVSQANSAVCILEVAFSGDEGLGALQFAMAPVISNKVTAGCDVGISVRSAKGAHKSYVAKRIMGNDKYGLFPLVLSDQNVLNIMSGKLSLVNFDEIFLDVTVLTTPGMRSQLTTPGISWAALPTAPLLIGIFERTLSAIGVGAKSTAALAAMIEHVFRMCGDNAVHTAAMIVRAYMQQAESYLLTFAAGPRSSDRFEGPTSEGEAAVVFNAAIGLASKRLLDEQASSVVSPPKRDLVAQDHGRGGDKKKRGNDKRMAAAGNLPPTDSQPGSKATMVEKSSTGKYLRLGSMFYDLAAITKDLSDNKSAFPVEFVHLALLSGNPSHARKLSFCSGAVPSEAMGKPYSGFTASTYKLAAKPSDF